MRDARCAMRYGISNAVGAFDRLRAWKFGAAFLTLAMHRGACEISESSAWREWRSIWPSPCTA
jgi:hypothetical protein